MASAEIISIADVGSPCHGILNALLDSYLCAVGIVSREVRSGWVEYILRELRSQIGEIAENDIAEEAVERMRHALDVRLAAIAGLDPTNDGGQVAAMLVVLQEHRHADLLNKLFEDRDLEPALSVREQLRIAFASDRPRPVPAEAPMDLPVQTIALRSLNPLRWLRVGAG